MFMSWWKSECSNCHRRGQSRLNRSYNIPGRSVCKQHGMIVYSEYSIAGAKLVVLAGVDQCIRKQEMAVVYCLYLLTLIYISVMSILFLSQRDCIQLFPSFQNSSTQEKCLENSFSSKHEHQIKEKVVPKMSDISSHEYVGKYRTGFARYTYAVFPLIFLMNRFFQHTHPKSYYKHHMNFGNG